MIESLHKQKGFTLIEVIVTIVIAAIVGTVIFTYMGSVLTRSHEPIFMVKDLAEAVEVMEEVTVAYQDYLNGDITSWSAFESEVGTIIAGTGQMDTSVSIDGSTYGIIEVIITRNNQTVSAIFTQ